RSAVCLRLYRALLDPQAAAFRAVLSSPSPLAGEGRGGGLDLPAFAVKHILPGVIDATVGAGPPVLRDGVIALFASADLEALMKRWLAGEALPPVETYLARATSSPLLEALAPSPLEDLGSFTLPRSRGRAGEGALCPTCGGLPQLSYHALSGEPLVSGPRYLVC